MGKSLNQVTIMGNLTRTPELRVTPQDQSVVNFSLALNRSYKGTNDEWQEDTTFVDVVAWSKLAEQISGRVDKGNRVLVQGRLQSRSWEQDGVKKSKLEVLATDVTFLDKEETQE
jgi:single-strand DNA-binding protein